jgi:uncharacterized protein YjgD (DUF1641 family)
MKTREEVLEERVQEYQFKAAEQQEEIEELKRLAENNRVHICLLVRLLEEAQLLTSQQDP